MKQFGRNKKKAVSEFSSVRLIALLSPVKSKLSSWPFLKKLRKYSADFTINICVFY